MIISELISKYNITRKELVYLILPFFFLLILFPAVILSEQVFITGPHDTLLGINSGISVIKNPISLWNNQWINGLPEYANPLSDRYYPFSYPIFILTQDTFIVNLILIVHLYLAYLFFFKLSGLMTKNSELRMISALFYIFSGVMLSRVFAGHVLLVYALTWIPLLYYAFFKIVWDDDVTIKNIGIISMCLALIFFTGAVYYLFYSCLILLVFFIYYVFKKIISNGASLAVICAFIIGALILAIKAIPVIVVSSAFGRIDNVDPLGDGGILENNLASIIFGTPIDKAFGFYETIVLIGMIPMLLIILALIFDREDRSFPAFLAIIVAFIWADGGNTLLFFIHLLPGLTNFRVAGRVLGALLPILLLFAIYGLEILNTRMKSGEVFLLNHRQKRNIIIGIAILIMVKCFELPFQTSPSLEAILSIIFIIAFVGMLYFNLATIRNLVIFLIVSGIVNGVIVIYNVYNDSFVIKSEAIIILVIVIASIVFFNRKYLSISDLKTNTHIKYICIFLIIGFGIVIVGNTSYLHISDDIQLDKSPAIDIIDQMNFTSNTSQIWVLETGWFIQHMDFTYWFLKKGIHPVHAYYPYFLNTMISPTYKIGDITYYTSNYIVDNLYLENGKQNIPEVTFKVNNISVYKPEYVLPNVFVVRNNQLIPIVVDKFSPDEVIISGQFLPKDIAVLKTSFYPGWKMNGIDTVNTGNMVGSEIGSITTSVTFRFDPLDIKIAAILSGLGCSLLIIAIIKRREIEKYLREISKNRVPIKGIRKKKK